MDPKVRKLIDQVYHVQRSDAWLAARSTLITATDIAAILGVGRFGTAEGIMYKKCGFKKRFCQRSIDAMAHGVKFEDDARDEYCRITGERVHEVGLVIHPEHVFLGASPDGITESGKLIEIKCPTGPLRTEVPDYYMTQIQLGMECTDLDQCDYMEYKPDTKELRIINVKRDRDWFSKSLPILRAFWDLVVDRKTKPLCEIIDETE
jgi:putative phage-type endonuclease